MFRPSMTSLRAGRVIAPSPAPAMPRMFATSSLLRTDISSSALPKQKPVGAFRGGIFGFLLGSVAAGVSVYYYVLKEYRVSNELLTDDIYALQSASQKLHKYVTELETKVDQLQKKK
ncbi:conserved hypothetical protein [Talaromyces stipitatus ATCC 10500]|uniref:Uncharacterized protein n=1 Tax=Talaromyces stipitatus (strain ATCC 10500 / CBS 375.48 / QM 6759 / NRRL 1006) TaxID=441959 RepID=B8LT13_TALSN|nr:uncharacterized protein TSTA_069420 [Talaromyces stipitatus ATCC 10500]EED23521.1 conserved hypothetical protein [Talaromyces stipitatus ATCC 10500]